MSKKSQFDGLLKNALQQQIQQEDDIKNFIVIDKELQEWIPPLSKEEYEQLKANILQNGCLDKLIVWKKAAKEYVLVDGHNRYQICKTLGIVFQTHVVEFADKEAVKLFMLIHQLGRRNLTLEQVSYLRGKRYEQEKAAISNPLGVNGQQQLKDILSINLPPMLDGQTVEVKGQNVLQPPIDTKNTTAEKLAKEYKVSDKTIQRDYEFAKGLDNIGNVNPALKQAILAGTVKVKKEVVQGLAKTTIQNPVETVDDLLKVLQPLNQSIATNSLKEALTKVTAQLVIEVKGQWLLDNGLADYWRKARKIKSPIQADFIDKLTWEEAKKLFKLP